MPKPRVAKDPQKPVKIKKELKSKNSNSKNDVEGTSTAEKTPSGKLDPTFIGNVSTKSNTKVTNLVDKCKISRTDLVVAEEPKKDHKKLKSNHGNNLPSTKLSAKLPSKTQNNETETATESEISTPPESVIASTN